ncbi:hypothetical protein [Candidatus Pristimantibacillus sp. PTI5]|uniref:hypothetical protein n=1 Tax=Candidatus Pristimantibacillus sp. PTI5 TaxID=3400422 RepID=UPI003B013B5A
MGKYELWLDESGDFVKDIQDQSIVPSVVGGALVPTEHGPREAAKLLIDEIKASHGIYSKTIHATEMDPVSFARMANDLFAALSERSIVPITFENRERLEIIDADLTYLNLLAEGVIQLFQTLAVNHKEVSIHIIAARRVRTGELAPAIGIDLIPSADYISRLRERITIGMARRSLTEQMKNWTWSFALGSARQDEHLMIADIISHAWYRKERKFKAEQYDRLIAFFESGYTFTVFDRTSRVAVKQLAADGEVGAALYEWLLSVGETATAAERVAPVDLVLLEGVLQRLVQLPEYSQQAQLMMLESRIKTLSMVERNFDSIQKQLQLAEKFMIPFLSDNCPVAEQFIFGIYFNLLTTATHQGDVVQADLQIQRMKIRLPKFGGRWETIRIAVDFYLRESVHLLNIYDTEKAIEQLSRLERFLDETIGLFSLVGDFGIGQEELRSSHRGKILGTRLQAYLFHSRRNPKYYDLAREDSNKAIAEFDKPGDQLRQLQYRAQLECDAGECKEAYQWLLKAYQLPAGESSPTDLLEAVLRDHKSGQLFGAMHYSRLMARAIEKDAEQFGKELYDAWMKCGVERKLLKIEREADHPYEIILWKTADTYARTGSLKAAVARYDEAIRLCQQSAGATIRSIGLGIALERAAAYLEAGDKFEKEAQRALKDAIRIYDRFMDEQLPEPMLAYFEPWRAHLVGMESSDRSLQASKLRKLAWDIPY